jgi:hypothetical protein
MFFLFTVVFSGCVSLRPSGPIKLTVTHIIPNGYESGIKEVWARKGYKVFMAQCEGLPDTVKVGTVLTAMPTDKPCNCLFNRIR